MKFKKPVIISAVSALAISGALLTQPIFAQQATKTIKAIYNNIAIVYNGTTLSSDASTEPFMINGTTYLPLRMVGTALDKKVTWDGNNKRVIIEDKQAPVDQSTVAALNNQINTLTQQAGTLNQQIATLKSEAATKDATIAQLQKDKAALQAKTDSTNNNTNNLSTLERKLNNNFGNYSNTQSDIVLNGNSDKITIRINVNKSGWNNLSSNKRNSLVQDIVDSIRNTYNNATISGTVRSANNSDTLATISVRSSGTVTVTNTAIDISQLQNKINNNFGTYKNVNFNIKLSGDETSVALKIYVNRADWNSLSSSQRSSFKNDIVSNIQDEYSRVDISGTIYDNSDNSKLDTFTN